MYKYPYKKTVHDAIPADFLDASKHDLCECVFGYTNKDGSSLKGRVQFGHAICTSSPRGKTTTFSLSSPRSSYYPLYKQDGRNWDYGEPQSLIAGHKRYPVRNKPLPMPQGNAKMTSPGELLPSGTVFHEKIHFFNKGMSTAADMGGTFIFRAEKKGYPLSV